MAAARRSCSSSRARLRGLSRQGARWAGGERRAPLARRGVAAGAGAAASASSPFLHPGGQQPPTAPRPDGPAQPSRCSLQSSLTPARWKDWPGWQRRQQQQRRVPQRQPRRGRRAPPRLATAKRPASSGSPPSQGQPHRSPTPSKEGHLTSKNFGTELSPPTKVYKQHH
uniref:Uncharacterized protein n=1 Tax=Sphaerodactylus townsendi TaxID=933632 RepID=A0ACB8G958_9SAUR